MVCCCLLPLYNTSLLKEPVRTRDCVDVNAGEVFVNVIVCDRLFLVVDFDDGEVEEEPLRRNDDA